MCVPAARSRASPIKTRQSRRTLVPRARQFDRDVGVTGPRCVKLSTAAAALERHSVGTRRMPFVVAAVGIGGTNAARDLRVRAAGAGVRETAVTTRRTADAAATADTRARATTLSDFTDADV